MQHTEAQTAGELAAEIEVRLSKLPNFRIENVRALRREFSKRLSRAEPQVVVELALQLREQDDIVHRFLAYELVHHHQAALRSLGEQELDGRARPTAGVEAPLWSARCRSTTRRVAAVEMPHAPC